MKITYLTPSIVDGVALDQPESPAEYFARGLNTLELYGSTLKVRHSPDDDRSVTLTADAFEGDQTVVLVGFGMFYLQMGGSGAAAAMGMLESIQKVKDLTPEDEFFQKSMRESGLKTETVEWLRTVTLTELGHLDAYEANPWQKKDLKESYKYHAPKAGQTQRYETIRDIQKQFAEALYHLCPRSNELDQAINRLNEVGFWANASIARNESEVLLPVTVDEIKRVLDETRSAYEAAKDRYSEPEPTEPEWSGQEMDEAITAQRNAEAELAQREAESIVEFPTGEPKPE